MGSEFDGRPAFDLPGGEGSRASRAKLIDFAHLAKQTMEDRALEQEVLAMFAHQAAGVAERICHADREEQLRLAHTLKGSARGVGAVAIAECLASFELDPDDRALLKKLKRLVEETRAFIASINR